MIKSINLCLKHKGLIDRTSPVVFQPGLNVIVGPNGSGKSSLLNAIYRCPECVTVNSDHTEYHYFNSEIMNPKRSEESFNGPLGAIIKVRAMFSSDGETMRDVLQCFPFNPGSCLLLDEPEAGHDLKWTIKIRKGLDQLAKRKFQIIVATHHPVFWEKANIIELKRDYIQKSLGQYLTIVTSALS